MGLKLTLIKENNALYQDFIDAYWKIDSINYTNGYGYGVLCAYPSRIASQMHGVSASPSTLPVGGFNSPTYNTILYSWKFNFELSSLFPNGIPLDENIQKTQIYNFIKAYTNLPFEDVYEEGQNT